MSSTYRFIEPLDVLFLRGNKLFGDAGSHGESLVPPWPSVAAGALRSLLLAHDGFDLSAFARGSRAHPTLGTPQQPGPFTLTGFDLARRRSNGQIECLHALPADLLLTEDKSGQQHLCRLQPQAPAAGLVSSAALAQWPVLAQPSRDKPVGGHWLTQAGWADYLHGRTPAIAQLVSVGQLWRLDARVGVGLDEATRSAADGKLFTAQAVAFQRDVGFLAAVQGAELPKKGLLRLGGDGRGAALLPADHAPPAAPWDAIASARRCRIVLTTPGLFAQGWLPTGVTGVTGVSGMTGDLRFALQGISGRLVCAAVPRAEVVSGWNLALGQPKPAERAAPSGSVYWIDDLDATPAQLRKLAEQGLWLDANQNASRRAEGFNRFSFAAF